MVISGVCGGVPFFSLLRAGPSVFFPPFSSPWARSADTKWLNHEANRTGQAGFEYIYIYVCVYVYMYMYIYIYTLTICQPTSLASICFISSSRAFSLLDCSCQTLEELAPNSACRGLPRPVIQHSSTITSRQIPNTMSG